MRKFITAVIFLVFVPIFISLIFSFNFYQLIKTPDAIKSFVRQSNIYQNAAAVLQELIISDSKIDVNKEQIMQALDQYMGEASVKKYSDNLIDQVYEARKHPADAKIVIDLSLYAPDNIRDLVPTKQTYDVSNNEAFRAFCSYKAYLVILCLISILGLLLLVLAAHNLSAKLIWAGASLLTSSFVTGLIFFFGSQFLPKLVTGLGTMFKFEDSRIISGSEKVIRTLFESQTGIIAVETSILALLGAALIIAGVFTGRRKEELILGDFENSKADITNLPEKGLDKKHQSKS
jgi:hypothetical protein